MLVRQYAMSLIKVSFSHSISTQHAFGGAAELGPASFDRCDWPVRCDTKMGAVLLERGFSRLG